MCISVLLWQAHPLYPLLLLANRDEYLDRETEPLKWWEGGKMLGGRDVTAGGTWLASSREGKVALVTNVREVKSISAAKSRGDLPVRFLQQESPMEFAEEVGNEADEYNGFNLIVADILSKNMVYVTNRLKGESSSYMTRVSPGVHVLSNASLDTPWPKAQRLERGFKDLLDEYGVGEIPLLRWLIS
ncbi:putative transport and Golgi organization protein [Helianthus annuus]|nr:putative transport and Golgi organization protein [Helianthus annuus]